MTREEAIKEAYGIPVTKAQHEALQFLIPELRDSEDERIRKEIIDYLGLVGKCDGDYAQPMIDRWIAYLEKQKEQKSREDIINETVKDKAFTTKLLKSAGIVDETGELAEMYRSGQDSTKCIPDSVKFDEGFKTGREVGFCEGVESVKSAGCSEEEQTIIEGACNALKIHGHSKLADKLKSIRPINQEWSEDERMRKAIEYAIGQSTHSDGTLINGVSSEEALAYLEKRKEEQSGNEDRYMEGYMNRMNNALKRYIPVDKLITKIVELRKELPNTIEHLNDEESGFARGQQYELTAIEAEILCLQQEQTEVYLEKFGEIARHLIAVKDHEEDMRLDESEWLLLERIGYPERFNARKEE